MTSVSVIMAAHDAASTIEAAVHSIQRQTLTDWELIVVDDGSKDSTADLIEAMRAQDARIKLISLNEAGGSGAARNLAIEAAVSPYVAVHDADDISLPGRLGTQVEFLRTSSVVAVASQIAEFGDWGGPVVSHWPTEPARINRRQRRRQMPLPHPSCTFLRSEVLRVGGYDPACLRAQDFALMLRLGRLPMACLPNVHMLYRTERPASLSYVLASGRGGALASWRNHESGRREDRRLGPARRTIADARSVASWGVRHLRETRSVSPDPSLLQREASRSIDDDHDS
ncbi:hypothetical protein GCM10027596_22180 [Nocardioides korecus]